MGQESRDSTILILMIRDQIHSTIGFYQQNVLQHSFMDKLKEESVSFCGDSFIPRVVEICIVAMGCHPIELSSGGTLSGLLAKSTKTVISGVLLCRMDKKAVGAFAAATGTSPSNGWCESPAGSRAFLPHRKLHK